MGTLHYGDMDTPIWIDDHALAHLKVVIVTKLRRGESFIVSWMHPEDQPGGRSAIWLDPSIPLFFTFDEPEPPRLDREWLQELADSATSTNGIMLTSEHTAPPLPGDEIGDAA
ncbi:MULTISPECIES: hypothetical protein [Microbacterium]|uniref:DUF7882 family protein n=1 Tax=Microbacterium TaxID=33882 RepID=UPI000D650700|nr:MULTISPECIES: hypothetical protein [Microbacterium]